MSSDDKTVGNSPIVLYADQEHSGLRFVIFIFLFIGLFAGFSLSVALMEAFAPPALLDYTIFLACAGAIPFALLVIWGMEKLLKRYWHSGLSFILDQTGLFVSDRRDKNRAPDFQPDIPAIVWSENFSILKWYFKLAGYPRGGRERRAPAKWLCLAAEFLQEDARLNVYTFMSPEKAGRWIDSPGGGFQRLNQAELYDRSVRSRIGPPSRPTIPNELLHSKEGRYWLAEKRRWQYGIELSPEDFNTLLTYAQRSMTVPAFDPTGTESTNPT
jgi:hypothetical protein